MKSKILITADSLKDFLNLFDKEEILNDLEFGDTLYYSDGYIDQTILNGKNQIIDLLEFEYDFKGLVIFNANLNSSEIRLINDNPLRFEVNGLEKEIQTLENRLVEQNSYKLGKYKFEK